MRLAIHKLVPVPRFTASGLPTFSVDFFVEVPQLVLRRENTFLPPSATHFKLCDNWRPHRITTVTFSFFSVLRSAIGAPF